MRPRPRVIVLARDPAPVTGKVLLAAGVTCLDRAILAEQDLLHAIHRTAHGEPMFLTSDGHRHKTPVRLTNRETDVLELLSAGQRYAAIAHTLGIQVGTVTKYVGKLLDKFDAASKRDFIGVPAEWLRESPGHRTTTSAGE